jgi:hypothetical protein
LSIRTSFWNQIAIRKFRANRPAVIPVPRDGGRIINAVSLASQFPGIPIQNIRVADYVPADEASLLKYYFYEFQVGMYGVFPPMEPGLPSIDADPQMALDNAYTAAHRACFPAPVVPPEYQGVVDLGNIAVASPYACYVERAPGGGYQWDLTQLARYEHHEGLRSLGVRVLFRVVEDRRKLDAVQIDSEVGACRPGDPNWEVAKKLALCAATTHVSLVRHFNWVHLAMGGPFAIATRNCLPANHPLRRLLWPHMFGTQYSNQIVTKGQMVKGGDFETIFSFTHSGMCTLFEESYAQYDISVLDPERDAERRGIKDAGFETPALINRKAHFDVMYAHACRYLKLYYSSDAALGADAAVMSWIEALNGMVPNGVRALLGNGVRLEGVARLIAALIYMATVEHEILGTGLWNYQLWTNVQPIRVYKNGQREPIDVYQRLVNANFNLNVSRAQLMQDFSYLALDDKGANAFRKFNADLQELQARLAKEPFAYWKIYPNILEANINA